ncbi:flagellar basal body-associated FliL family protein [Seohaeicola saemankumensis]|nr:flagellar basal body-associated FliL family protein [Seohaeicola saemankumensis]MCA0870527.1 flagellar basal body-associated FliL family protein [Seohaeicola saemankumensis]
MTDATAQMPEEPADGAKKTGKLPLIIGLVLAVSGGAGGFLAVQAGLLPFGTSDSHEEVHPSHSEDGGGLSAEPAGEKHVVSPDALPDISYVSVDPITVSLTGDHGLMHLRFRAELEVEKAYAQDVELIRPRIVDVLNGYLRALEMEDLRNTHSLTRLRSQMLRRVQIVAGRGRVRDLLIMDFVLN